VSRSTVERDIAGIADECAGADSDIDLFDAVSTRLKRLVPFDGSAWFATDPVTILGTSPIRIENVEAGHCETYWERECRVEDALLFRDLARNDAGVGTLYSATGDRPGRSARYREFLAPQGYGDELRAAFRVAGSTWGVVDLFREETSRPFSAADAEVVRRVLPTVAAALRDFSAAGKVAPGPIAVDGPGTALFDDSGALLSLDEAAERLFTELGGPSWAAKPMPMTPVYGVIARAVAVSEGRELGPSTARMRAASGRWLTVHASCLRGRDGRTGPTAVTIEPAKSTQIAPIIVEAYNLTAREQEITRAVARGLSNAEIAADLFLSPHTVRDHLKAVFAKVGVASRGELTAKLFAEHYLPAIHSPQAHVQHVQI
jgi:DNA-binding CsgD family transcriptional regulator